MCGQSQFEVEENTRRNGENQKRASRIQEKNTRSKIRKIETF